MPGNGQTQIEDPCPQPEGAESAESAQSRNLEPSAIPATRADFAKVEALGKAALAEKQDQRGGGLLLRTRFAAGLSEETISEAVLSQNKMIWVGELSEAAVGFAQAELKNLDDGGRIAELQALYVLPGARGVGVGESLMEAVLAWAEASGAEGVDSVALPGDRATKNFFEQFGLKARAILVHRSLDG